MMNKMIVLLFILLAFSNAKTITVDNKYPYAGDYKTLQEAHDAASDGDVIYVAPSLVPYDAITVTKKLSFYGVGFDILENIGEPLTISSSISGEMTFSNGSSGSKIEGFDGRFSILVDVVNITIKRNNLIQIHITNGGSGTSILQNKLQVLEKNVGHGLIWIEDASNIAIFNNILYADPLGTSAIFGGDDLTIKNNVIRASYDYYSRTAIFNYVNNSLIVNNIFTNFEYSFDSNNNIFQYNMEPGISLPDGFGNIKNVNMKTVFVDPDNYDFHLLPDSPARSAGENGTDMGIYGGDAPFVDGGFPELPSILQLVVPTVGSQKGGLEIKFKAKSNN